MANAPRKTIRKDKAKASDKLEEGSTLKVLAAGKPSKMSKKPKGTGKQVPLTPSQQKSNKSKKGKGAKMGDKATDMLNNLALPRAGTPGVTSKKGTKEGVEDSLKVAAGKKEKNASREMPSPPPSDRDKGTSRERVGGLMSREGIDSLSKERVGALSKEKMTGSKKGTKKCEDTGKTGGTLSSPSVPSLNEKWPGEAVAAKWMDTLDFVKVKDEFEVLQKMSVDTDKCKKWKRHRKLNQSADYPVPDANLIKCPDADDYVNMSLVELPLSRSVYIGQIPVAGAEEAFWKAIFEMRVTFMTILNESPVEFFPNNGNDFRHYGTMFVNNRRVETISVDVNRFAMEILPSGYSNSIICTITVIKNCKSESIHVRQSIVVKEILEMTTHMTTCLPDENHAIISKNGAGRSGYFASLLVAINCLNQKNDLNVSEIVKSIRSQRPKAAESLKQYVSIYIALLYYIKKKLGNASDKKDQDGLIKKCATLTDTFALALTAEINNTGKSTMAPV